MNNLQKESLEILLNVNDLFIKYKIPYFLYGGTLLGSIRHKGFIPWDDDLDIVVPRQYYDRAHDILVDNLSKDYYVQSNKLNKFYANAFFKVRNKNLLIKEVVPKTQSNYTGAWLDVFPYDKISKNSVDRKTQFKKVNKINKLIKFNLMVQSTNESGIINIIKKSIECFNVSFHKYFFWLPHLFNKREKLMSSYLSENEAGDDYLLGDLSYMYYESFEDFSKTLVENSFFDSSNTILGEFEGYYFPIPKNYDDHLKSMYGDYMKIPKEENRKTHNIIINED